MLVHKSLERAAPRVCNAEEEEEEETYNGKRPKDKTEKSFTGGQQENP